MHIISLTSSNKVITSLFWAYMLMILFFISHNKKLIKETKSQLSCEFDMKDLGELHYCLGIQIKRDYQNRKLLINPRNYLENMLELFRMEKCKPVCTPSQVGVCLSTHMSPKRKQEKEMERVSYVVWLVALSM